ncbi:hypothetical protein SPRG_08938 [Saprolegnia parasitica CBS 223.65]|uniref:Helicase-associated domain-containing protein n=1 Tax=Saprolegnia parasitica (strain CBS 223.65) TaxID=695850 RepID=A0A067C4E3_SAPPC|nr:hypothetical protein SPRG_08938 [Saprolegnia parasitica CBS 223.65]KDO25639.1 hypothetical protein SPRG_08938 [Saprolegnia parasitica CBS 223.65]|eukprot:XP_012203671.1 hypothetical protein SPRG_08938 [Saprolegnia parasitica CBS 223.65]
MTLKRPLSPPAKPRRAGTAIDDDAWLDVLLALKVYRLLYGHCKVPLSYFVPRLDHTPTAWPLHLTGMHLGAAVKTLRTCYLPEHFVSALNAIGFVWRQDGRLIPTGTSLFDEIDAVPFAAMITALEVHVATHQTTKIPAHATFVHTSVWHRSWTYVLADVVPALEAHFYQLSDVQMTRLRDLGYCKQLPLWDDLMDLLQRYYEHVVPPGSGVAIDFVVPPDAIAWPSQWHGLELGLLFWSVGLTHTTTLSESRRRDLKTHKFVFNTVHTWAKVLDALTTYDSVSMKPSCFEMWRSYVTPTSAPWPEALRGYPLGRWYKVMCDAETNLLLPYLTQDALVGLRGGLRLLPQELMTESTTAQAYWDAFLTAYRCICANAATIPPKFVMPSTESVPKVAHGFLLGAAIASVRNHVLLHPAHRAALDKLGLAWSTSVPEAAATEPVEIVEWVPTPRRRYYRWPDKMRALEAFKELHGHCGVPTAFVVPSSTEWPEDLHGCRLGALVSRFFAEPRSVPADYAPLISALGVVSVPGDTIVAPRVDADGTVVKAFAGSDADTASDSSDAPMDVTTHDDVTVTDGEHLTDATMVAVSTDDADEDPPVDMSDDASDNDDDVSDNDDDASDNNVLCGSLPPVSSPVVHREPEPDAPSWTTTCALSHSAQMTQEAANVYYELTGHRHISSSFRVPPDDMRWPMHLWDWPLGQAWMHLHRRAPSLKVNWDALLLALGIYARATGHGHVPRHFVVPDDERTWPVHLTGFDLGELVHCIRSGRVTLSHAHAVALSAMDFEWTAP